MKRIIAVLVLLALLTAGCASEEKEITEEPVISEELDEEPAGTIVEPEELEEEVIEEPEIAEEAVEQETPKKEEPQKELSYEITNETTGRLMERFTKGTKLVLSDTFKTMKPEETYVAAIGVTNTGQFLDTFKLIVEFKEAYDKYSNAIPGIKKEDAAAWLSLNTFEQFKLGNSEQKIIPVTIKTGKLANGKTPPPGVYVFKVFVMQLKDSNEFKYIYAETKLSVQLGEK